MVTFSNSYYQSTFNFGKRNLFIQCENHPLRRHIGGGNSKVGKDDDAKKVILVTSPRFEGPQLIFSGISSKSPWAIGRGSPKIAEK